MDRWRQAVLLAAILLAVIFLVLASADAGMVATVGAERCPLKFSKWFGCVLAAHENLSGGLIGAAGALFAAWLAWQAIMNQISQAEKLSESRRQREEIATRTVLPLALSDLSRYARESIQLLSKYVYGERPVVPPNLETPWTGLTGKFRSYHSDRRRALELLATSPDGATEAILAAHGVSVEQTVDLVRAGLATTTAERGGDGSALDRGRADAVGPQGRPWTWASGHSAGSVERAAHDYAPTREAAMEAFAKSWRRE